MLLGIFGIGAAYPVIVRQTPDLRLRLGMRVGHGASRVFFVTLVSFFVSMMFVLRKNRGYMHRRMGDRHGSVRMRRRVWTGMAIDRRMDSEDRRKVKLFPYLYSCLYR